MKVIKPPRETLSSLNYRDADETPTTTAPELIDFSRAALALLDRKGIASEGGENSGDKTWSLTTTSPSGTPLEIHCAGPDLPAGIPEETAHPSIIPTERPWVSTYRLSVKAPLVVFDIAWRPDVPLRIMSFSRGNWEDDLVALAK